MNKKFVVGAVALASAGLASVCCIGPLVVTALGLGGLGLAAGLTRYRPLFLGLTALALIGGFYLAYRKREADCADGTCEVGAGSRTMKGALWAVTLAAAAMATFPSWYARLLAQPAGAAAAVPAGSRTLFLKVAGMDCAACAVSIKASVEKVPGVRSADIDFDAARATVVADARTLPEAVLKAVAAAGYTAQVER